MNPKPKGHSSFIWLANSDWNSDWVTTHKSISLHIFIQTTLKKQHLASKMLILLLQCLKPFGVCLKRTMRNYSSMCWKHLVTRWVQPPGMRMRGFFFLFLNIIPSSVNKRWVIIQSKPVCQRITLGEKQTSLAVTASQILFYWLLYTIHLCKHLDCKYSLWSKMPTSMYFVYCTLGSTLIQYMSGWHITSYIALPQLLYLILP